MNHQMYFRATNIMKKLENTLDKTTSRGIIDNIIKYLYSEEEIPAKYLTHLHNSFPSICLASLPSHR